MTREECWQEAQRLVAPVARRVTQERNRTGAYGVPRAMLTEADREALSVAAVLASLAAAPAEVAGEPGRQCECVTCGTEVES